MNISQPVILSEAKNLTRMRAHIRVRSLVALMLLGMTMWGAFFIPIPVHAQGGILPTPGASCNAIQDPTARKECLQGICPRICNRSPLPSVGGVLSGRTHEEAGCQSDTDYTNSTCVHGVCLFGVEPGATISPDDPRITSSNALPCNYTLDDLVGVGVNLSNLIFGITGSLLLLFIIYGGYQMFISLGNAEALQAAKKTLTAAFVGFIIIVTATIFVRFGAALIGGQFGGEVGLGKTGICFEGGCPQGYKALDLPEGAQSPCTPAQSYCVEE